MFTSRRFPLLVVALALVALAIPSSASAQATRTWVSGVGDDVNPCSRTAPCKTFAGTISKTAAGGEINCLDPGGFGAVTIVKSIAIKCQYTEGGIVVGTGTNGVIINAGANDRVTLRGIDINGVGTGAQTALNGIKILSARHVNIFDSEISRFQAGVNINPTSNQTSVVAARNHIHDNGIGVINTPGSNTISFTSATLRHNDIQDNTCGVVVSSFGANASTPAASNNCGTNPNTSGINKTAIVDVFHNSISLNSFGIFSRGTFAAANIAYSEITANGTFGLHTVDSGVLRTFTPATNVINNNAASDPPNASAPLSKRHAKKHGKKHAKRGK